MSVHISVLVWPVPMTPTRKIVLLKLADCANDMGESIYPGVGRIARECCISERTVQYTLREFEREGLLRVCSHENGGRGKARVYAFDLDRLRDYARRAEAGEKGANDDKKGADDDIETRERVQMTTKRVQSFCTPTVIEPSEDNSMVRSDQNRDLVQDQFTRFRSAYPKRDGPNPWAKARERFAALVRKGVDAERIIAGAERYAAHMEAKGKAGTEFVCLATTYLNQRRWEDDEGTEPLTERERRGLEAYRRHHGGGNPKS